MQIINYYYIKILLLKETPRNIHCTLHVRVLPKKNHLAYKVTTNFANMQEVGQKSFDFIPKTKKCKPKVANNQPWLA